MKTALHLARPGQSRFHLSVFFASPIILNLPCNRVRYSNIFKTSQSSKGNLWPLRVVSLMKKGEKPLQRARGSRDATSRRAVRQQGRKNCAEQDRQRKALFSGSFATSVT